MGGGRLSRRSRRPGVRWNGSNSRATSSHTRRSLAIYSEVQHRNRGVLLSSVYAINGEQFVAVGSGGAKGAKGWRLILSFALPKQ